MEKEFVCRSLNGRDVFVDLEGSHAATHIKDNPNVLPLSGELLAQSVLEGSDVAFDRDMGRVVGVTDLVETTADDDIIYAKRPNRDNYTRLVRGRKPVPTSFLTVILREQPDGYDLWSAWLGRLVPTFPGDDHADPDSVVFWRNHALVFETQTIQLGTETLEQPW